MIGTLVVQLPVEGGHTGGCLTVRHMGETFTHNFEQVSWQRQICNSAEAAAPNTTCMLPEFNSVNCEQYCCGLRA